MVRRPDTHHRALPNLRNATALLRQGKLMAATRAIQQALAPGPQTDAPAQAHHAPIIEGEFRVVSPTRDADAAPAENAASVHPDAARGAFRDATFDSALGARRYKVYEPTRRSDGHMPLVVMLHGCTQDPDDFARGTRMNALADEFGFAVLYPAQETRANGSKCWNWFRREDQRRDHGEPGFIADLTRHVTATLPIDPARVFVAGLSAGGAMAAILGREYADIYAAVGVHSGLPVGAATNVGAAFAAMRSGSTASVPAADGATRAPTIVFHGTGDATVHPSNGDEVLRDALVGRTLREESTAVAGAQRRVWRDADGVTMGELWQVRDLGHAWSGGSADGSYTAPVGPDASREMLRFFQQR